MILQVVGIGCILEGSWGVLAYVFRLWSFACFLLSLFTLTDSEGSLKGSVGASYVLWLERFGG